jgi:glucose-1-phosphate cytidylyltransferase
LKVAILCGGAGTRLREETEVRPKPMVEIGGQPILWHIMKSYATYGFKEFVIALGYKGEVIKHYFVNYQLMHSSFSIHLGNGGVRLHAGSPEDWLVHLVETGFETATGGRVRRLAPGSGKRPSC